LLAKSVRPAASLLLLMTVLCGLGYPLVITGIARLAFPIQAEGSLIQMDSKLVGSQLIGQSFTDPRYFWGRPSATTPQAYNAAASAGSNLGPLNPALIDQVKANAKRLRDADPDNRQPIPVELVTASASGLDPEISRAAADYQAARVARARGIPVADLQTLIATHAKGRVLGFLGEQRVNVLELNLALGKLH
jgi:potassium-transporting ATPase KdpC subunit